MHLNQLILIIYTKKKIGLFVWCQRNINDVSFALQEKICPLFRAYTPIITRLQSQPGQTQMLFSSSVLSVAIHQNLPRKIRSSRNPYCKTKVERAVQDSGLDLSLHLLSTRGATSKMKICTVLLFKVILQLRLHSWSQSQRRLRTF